VSESEDALRDWLDDPPAFCHVLGKYFDPPCRHRKCLECRRDGDEGPGTNTGLSGPSRNRPPGA
jgi:hypothetical protein